MSFEEGALNFQSRFLDSENAPPRPARHGGARAEPRRWSSTGEKSTLICAISPSLMSYLYRALHSGAAQVRFRDKCIEIHSNSDGTREALI